MKPVVIQFPDINHTTFFSGTAVNLAAGSQLLLNGITYTDIFSGATKYEYTMGAGIEIFPLLVNPSGVNYSTVTFTIVGENAYGDSVTWVGFGPGAAASVATNQSFHKFTSITANAVIQPLFTIGLSGSGGIYVETDYWNKEALYTLQISDTNNNVAGPDIGFEYTLYPPYQFVNGVYTPTPHEFFEDSFTEIAVDANNVTTSPNPLTLPVSDNCMISLNGVSTRVFLVTCTSSTTYTEDTGGFKLTFMQQGAQF